MKKQHYIFVLFIFISIVSYSQNTYKSIIYKTYVEGKMNQWKAVIDKMETIKINSNNYLMELIEYQYGYIVWCLGNDKESEANNYLKLIKSNLEKVEELGGENESIILSYKSAFVGFEIRISMYKAPFIARKSSNYSEKAMNKGSQIPIVLINYGNLLLNSPSIYGGDKEKAIQIFLRAKKQFELTPELTNDNWLYLYLLTLIGKAYYKIEDTKNARKYYEFALEVEPDFKHVKENILPNL